jgi:hypothetical protein
MEEDRSVTRCPFFEEVLVAFCRAYPVKKMVPSDRIQAHSACTCDSFQDCSMFKEVMARMDPSEGETPVESSQPGPGNP